MSNPVPPALAGLTGLVNILTDGPSRKSWSQIEKLDREQAPPEAISEQGFVGAAVDVPAGSDNAEHVTGEETPFDLARGEAREPGDRSGATDRRRSEGEGLNRSPMFSFAPAQAPSRPSGEGKWEFLSSPVPLSAGSHASPTGQTISGVLAGIEHSLNASGPFVAAQKLHAAVSRLSADQAPAFLEAASALVSTIFERVLRRETGVNDPEKQRDGRTAIAIAHIAASVDKDPRAPSAMHFVQKLSPAVFGPEPSKDNMLFAGLGQAIGVGAGAKLALVMLSELNRRGGDPARAQLLLALMLAGFVRLGERIDEAYTGLLAHIGPLCMEWTHWKKEDEEGAIHLLIDSINTQPALLEDLGPRLERLEQAGLEAFRVIRDLATLAFDSPLREVHTQFLGSQSIFSSISGSRLALRDIRYVSRMTGHQNAGTELEAIRLTLTNIGFDAPHSAFLADLSQSESNALMLRGNWTTVDFARMELQGRAFQRLLTFLNGQYIVPNVLDLVAFDNPDMQV